MKKSIICLLALALPVCVFAQQDGQTSKNAMKELDRQIKQQMTVGMHNAATQELLRLLKSPAAKKTRNLEKHVRRLVEAGANVNGQDKDGNTVFTLALRTGDAGTVKFLVRKGITFANMSCKGLAGDYLVALAQKNLCKDGYAHRGAAFFDSDVELAKFFRSRNEKFSQPSMRALAEAVSAGNWPLAEYYVQWFGANITDNTGYTALHVLAERNDLAGIQFLLEKGANPTAKDDDGTVPAAMASSSNAKDMLLKASAKWQQNFPLHRAVRKNDVKTASALVAAGADVNEGLSSDGRTPLIDAARFNKKEAVDFLLENGADVNKASYQGYTPLHWTVLQSDGKLSMVKRLVEAGADINAVDSYGNTPFFYAVKYERQAMTEYLLKKGANPSIENKKGETAGGILAQRAAEEAQQQLWDSRYR